MEEMHQAMYGGGDGFSMSSLMSQHLHVFANLEAL